MLEAEKEKADLGSAGYPEVFLLLATRP